MAFATLRTGIGDSADDSSATAVSVNDGPAAADLAGTYDGGMSQGAVSGKRVLLAQPRGYCAGVERAIDSVEKALAVHGAPVYVRKQIVHNKHVVADLEAKGAIFVEETSEVPEGSIVCCRRTAWHRRSTPKRPNATC